MTKIGRLKPTKNRGLLLGENLGFVEILLNESLVVEAATLGVLHAIGPKHRLQIETRDK